MLRHERSGPAYPPTRSFTCPYDTTEYSSVYPVVAFASGDGGQDIVSGQVSRALANPRTTSEASRRAHVHGLPGGNSSFPFQSSKPCLGSLAGLRRPQAVAGVQRPLMALVSFLWWWWWPQKRAAPEKVLVW